VRARGELILLAQTWSSLCHPFASPRHRWRSWTPRASALARPLGLGPPVKAGRGHRAPDLTACFRVSGFTRPRFWAYGARERRMRVMCGLAQSDMYRYAPSPQPAVCDQPGIFFLFAPVSLPPPLISTAPSAQGWTVPAYFFFLLLTRTLTSQLRRTGQPATAPAQPCPPP
jgi:hypothetical protein